MLNGKNMRSGTGTSTPVHTATTRPLVLLQPTTQTRISINVPSTSQEWIAAEVARDTFQDWIHEANKHGHLVGFDAAEVDDESEGDAEDEKELVLTAYFISHVAGMLPFPATATSPATAAVLLAAFTHFNSAYLSGTDIHTLGASLPAPVRALIISSFFVAKSKLEAEGFGKVLPKAAGSALLKKVDAKEAELYALFGGQGMNEVYFDELQTLYDLYAPLLTPFLARASEHLVSLSAAESATLLFDKSLDALAWLQNPSTRPDVSYLASCAVSLPLIGLTQLAQYVVYGKGSSLGPAELGAKFQGATGHSQGIISACVIAKEYPAAKDDGSDAWEPFYEQALAGLTVLFQTGLQGTLAFPPLAIAPGLVSSSVENGEGTPTAMLAVTGLELKTLEKKIAEVNGHVKSEGRDETVSVSLHNGAKAFVVTGNPKDLVGLAEALRKNRAPSGKDQSKIPYSKRLPVFSMRFLPINVPYHSHLLQGATEKAVAAIGSSDASFWSPSALSCAVYNTEDGSDLRQLSSGEALLTSIFAQIFTSPIYWATKATNFPATATHAIDFGTGGSSGIGSLCARNWEGRGIRSIMLGNRGEGVGAGKEAWGSKVIDEDKWTEKFRPRLVRTSDGKIHIDTPFSRLLSKPPLMVAGMTPTTVKAGFVSAVLKAGYHVELAGGGHYNEKAVRAKVAEIQKLVNKPGVGITLNCLYINQRQWTFQLPLWQQMKKEGLPVEGLCVAAGIPSTEKAKEIIDGLRDAGIKHVSFKPGSVDGIRQVVNIASSNPDFPIILQWTGGRAGGHHSCEDFHAPILSTYASIRQHPNIKLVGGSGFGDAEGTYPYLSGEWSEKYGVARMPFDGFLFASWVMVAKEAHTSESVKQLIVDAPGVDDDKWEQTYEKPTGGIMTVNSELGEPIHKVATRGVKLWAEFDKKVFSLPKEKQVAWLADNKKYVIDRLNADFQKPWFPAKADGTACDLADMTYAEVNARLVRLMYVAHEKRWIDPSLRNLVGDWIRRVEERLSNVNASGLKVSALQSYTELNEPDAFLRKFLLQYPEAQDQILASADVSYFLAIAQRPGQKPVPFIPVLDASFAIWFKKDSLWQAEDIEAVFDQDPQRVCILQGPVAVKHCTSTRQPIADMLGNIETSLAKKILDEYYGGDESSIPSIDYLAPSPSPADPTLLARSHITHAVESTSAGGEKHIYTINGVLPPTGDWLDTLAGPKLGWLQAFLSNVSIQHGDQSIPNPVKRVLAPRHGQRVELSLNKDGQPLKLDVFGGL
ncbi:hypothetical protein JCM1841_007037 [Sporobolomyces salmonicolor]